MAKTPAGRCSEPSGSYRSRWFIQSVTPRFKEALRWMAANRKAYHVVDEAELAKASGTEHHGGVCFLIKKRHGTSVAQWVAKAGKKIAFWRWKMWVTHIISGAIMRSCARWREGRGGSGCRRAGVRGGDPYGGGRCGAC